MPAITALPATSAPVAATSAFVAAWEAYQPYSDPIVCRGLEDEAVDAWCDAQLAAAADLAAAPAGSLAQLEAKLTAGIFWFGNSGVGNGMCGEEADLLRSCLTDLREIIAKAAAV